MFQREEVCRDERGEWLHSALRAAEEEDVRRLPEAEGMEFRFVEFLGDAGDDLEQLYEHNSGLHGDEEEMKRAVREWQPTRPAGDCWFIIGVYDTEDGPTACFTRPKGRHRLKLVDFNEGTGVGRWECRCGNVRKRQAAFMCEAPGGG